MQLQKIAQIFCSVLFFTGAGLIPAQARIACTLVQKIGAGEPVYQYGNKCDEQFAPASTFKLPLALMGFESGYFETPDLPAITYDPAINAQIKVWRQTTTPRLWLRHSIVWYSWWLTKQMGPDEFQRYVDLLDYGNRDLSGEPGKDNGLTHSWLGTSLEISPREQIRFLSRVVEEKLPVSSESIGKLKQAIPQYLINPDIRLSGKTGTAWISDANGVRTKKQKGWFVGWLEKAGVPYVFVHLAVDDKPEPGPAGFRARQTVLSSMANWIGGQ